MCEDLELLEYGWPVCCSYLQKVQSDACSMKLQEDLTSKKLKLSQFGRSSHTRKPKRSLSHPVPKSIGSNTSNTVKNDKTGTKCFSLHSIFQKASCSREIQKFKAGPGLFLLQNRREGMQERRIRRGALSNDPAHEPARFLHQILGCSIAGGGRSSRGSLAVNPEAVWGSSNKPFR